MARSRIRVFTMKCRRGCGTTLATMNRSIWGMSPETVKKFQGICENCMTEEEKRELQEASINAVKKKIGVRY